MLSCKDATELISQGMDRRLSLVERFGLRLHLLICRGCRATEQHLGFLRNASSAWRQHHEAPPSTPQGDSK
ncbi:zf-HC2 domain-containing protein [Sulfurisoma sediminicola]|uniref:Putative zinc finger protein n=1 Tax=Sulfurisoma sediminicola TaxID=1381557 RepID=A0A497X926_9PROT|nr:zf-HC2 domain-containing protein [Sulfurisoma sediminicola]RLJ62093.1 putative zinc finger protein [Sulfurisoma sediminicola]